MADKKINKSVKSKLIEPDVNKSFTALVEQFKLEFENLFKDQSELLKQNITQNLKDKIEMLQQNVTVLTTELEEHTSTYINDTINEYVNVLLSNK